MAKEYKIDDLISSEELYHHGIKGQKWGRRRYQNKDGSLTPAGQRRLDDYKLKERNRVAEKYQVNKLNYKRNKLEEEFLDKNDNYTFMRLSRARYKLLKAQTMEFLETKKIESMTYEDMMSERADVRKAKKFVEELEGKMFGTLTSLDTFKTNRRVGLEESIYAEYEARKNADYSGL